eukprot:Filipodium_phascolosomae@DN1006_c0_g1_i1.p1
MKLSGATIRRSTRIKVSGIGLTHEDTVATIFSRAGTIDAVHQLVSPNQSPIGAAIIEFQKAKMASKAVRLFDRTYLNKKILRVHQLEKDEAVPTRHYDWGQTKPFPATDGCGVFLAHHRSVNYQRVLDHVFSQGLPRACQCRTLRRRVGVALC